MVGLRAGVLSEDNFKTQLRRCRRYSNYEVAIFVKNKREVDRIVRQLRSLEWFVGYEDVLAFYDTNGNGGIKLQNGSRMYVKAFSHERARGNRYNYALVSEDIYLEDSGDTDSVKVSIAYWCHAHAKPYWLCKGCELPPVSHNPPSVDKSLTDFLISIM